MCDLTKASMSARVRDEASLLVEEKIRESGDRGTSGLNFITNLSASASYFLCRNVEWRRATLRKKSRNSLGVTVTYCFAVTKWGLFFVINKIYVCKKRMPFLTCRWAAAWAEFCSTFSVCAPPAWHNFPAWRRHTKKRLDQNTTKKGDCPAVNSKHTNFSAQNFMWLKMNRHGAISKTACGNQRLHAISCGHEMRLSKSRTCQSSL